MTNLNLFTANTCLYEPITPRAYWSQKAPNIRDILKLRRHLSRRCRLFGGLLLATSHPRRRLRLVFRCRQLRHHRHWTPHLLLGDHHCGSTGDEILFVMMMMIRVAVGFRGIQWKISNHINMNKSKTRDCTSLYFENSQHLSGLPTNIPMQVYHRCYC